MKRSYYIFSAGTLKRKDNTLELYKEDGEHTTIPIERVDDLYIFSEMQLNTRLLEFLAASGICVHFFNYYEFYTGSFYPRERLVSGNLLIHQVQHYEDNAKRLEIAKAIIDAASFNIHRNLRYYNERGRDFDEAIKQIESLRREISSCESTEMLMGVEGNIRKRYYGTWKDIFIQDVEFEKRVKRPPDNMVNSLISFLNSMVYTRVLSEIYKTQLNPAISYLHEPGEKRFSLSLDIAEVFKPLLAERLIFSLINKNIVTEDDFEKDLNYLKMKPAVLKEVVKQFDDRLNKTIKHRQLNKDVSYRYLMRLELYKLIKHLLGEKSYEGFKIWW
jgi:CRISPR-associated protein Cas1